MAVFANLLVLSLLAGAALSQQKIDLFVNNAKYDIVYPCYRQPAIIEGDSTGTKLIAFAEGRNISSCAPPLNHNGTHPTVPPASNEVGGLVTRLSSDGGMTWTQPHTIYSGNLGLSHVMLA